ncbi:MAG: murein biosynthesis integral membrane protein MurJ [Patescibacteria group bacterium]
MVRRILSFFSQTTTTLNAAAYVIAGFALASQILGIVRDRILAHIFGASPTLDVYYAAFRVPDLIFVSIASIVSLFILIPFLSEALKNGGKEAARQFLSEVSTVFFVFIIVASAIVWWFAPHLSQILYPGFDGHQHETLVELMRILLLSPILLGLSNIFSSATQLMHRFTIYALSPVLYNIGIIVGIIFFYPSLGLSGIGWGVVLGAALHLLVQIPVVRKDGLLPRPTLRIKGAHILRVVLLSLPRTLTLSLNQIVLVVLVGIASTLSPGSVTIFTFASNLYSAPLTLIGVSYSVAAFPTLSRLFSTGERVAFLEQLIDALRQIIFWSLPALVATIVLRAHIVRALLGSGAFDWSATRLTAAALAILAVSLVAHGVILLFVRAYYATGRTMRPFLITTGGSILTVLSAYGGLLLFQKIPAFHFFIEALLRVIDVPGTAILVLAGGYSIGLICSAIIFWIIFRRDFEGEIPSGVVRSFWQNTAASMIAGAVMYVVLRATEGRFLLDTFGSVVGHALLAGILGCAAWVFMLIVLKNLEFGELIGTLRARFWRTVPIQPGPEEL